MARTLYCHCPGTGFGCMCVGWGDGGGGSGDGGCNMMGKHLENLEETNEDM